MLVMAAMVLFPTRFVPSVATPLPQPSPLNCFWLGFVDAEKLQAFTVLLETQPITGAVPQGCDTECVGRGEEGVEAGAVTVVAIG